MHSRRALAALALLVVASLRCAPRSGATTRDEIESVPEAAAMMRSARPVATDSARGVRVATGERGSWSGARLELELPQSAREPMRLSMPGEAPILIHRLDPGDAARTVEGNVVRYRGASRGADAVVFAREGDLEELFVLHERVALGYRLALPTQWSSRLGADSSSVEIADAAKRIRLVMRAAKAWDATGAALPVDVALENDVISLSVPKAHAYPVVVDPSWSSALTPIRIRSGHTATPLGTGEIFIAGGSSAKTTEILDPYAHTVTVGPEMAAGRKHHTATMLLSGKVLIAGGGTATAELYDPITRQLTATGSMSIARTAAAAVRLRSGKVLMAGTRGAFPQTDATAEIYDPATGTFAAAPTRLTKGPGAMALLADGKAYFIDGTDDPVNAHAEIFDPAAAGGAGEWSSASPMSPPPAGFGPRDVTRLRDGRIAIANNQGCASVGTEFCFGQIVLFDPSGSGSHSAGLDYTQGRVEPAAALLPGGEVIYIGGHPDYVTRAELYSGVGPSISNDGTTTAGHEDATSVVLPGGDVLAIGGSQAAIDRRTTLGVHRDAAGPMVIPRVAHSSVRMLDGKVLVSGGGTDQEIGALTASIEIFDAVSATSVDGGAMTVTRYQHTATTLRSGKVLITGGRAAPNGAAVASAEIYDPALAVGSRSRLVGAMSTARADHAATILPDGQVLITGGPGMAAEKSAEIFDPKTEKFTALPTMTAPRSGHGAVLMPNGKVLIISGDSAELFDPVTKKFEVTTPPGASRDGRTARVLPDGSVFVAGGSTFAPDIYDPNTKTWSFAPPQPYQRPETYWAMRPDGRLVSVGGIYPVDGVAGTSLMFDPLAAQVGSFHEITSFQQRIVRRRATWTLAGSGDLVFMGGTGCYGSCFADPVAIASLHDDGAPANARPTLDAVTKTAIAGTTVTLTGSGFANAPEGSTGIHSSSATNHPLAIFVSDSGDAVVPGTILDFTDTSATWLVPATSYHGHGLLFVSVNGVISRGVSVNIDPAAQAVVCTYDEECASGFCTDGVCCERRCDGKCEGCSTKRKLAGADGVCGAVPPGRDILGRCFTQQGQACKEGIECTTGFCAQGVCCDSSCTGQCQACNQATRVGLCSPVMEGACIPAPPVATCDGDHTITHADAPNVDCSPYKCVGQACASTCSSVKDCVAPFVCSLDGHCAPPIDVTPGEGGVLGCGVVGRPRAAGTGRGGLLAGAMIALSLLALRRTTRRRAQ